MISWKKSPKREGGVFKNKKKIQKRTKKRTYWKALNTLKTKFSKINIFADL